MKAVQLQQPGTLAVTTPADPDCPPGGVVVKITACGICSADAKMIEKGHRALVYPRIPGHEIVGRVVESRTDRFRESDRVQVAPGMRCGRCPACRRGADNQCPEREILGFTRDGGFAEFMAVVLDGPVKGAAWPLPDTLSDAAATLAEPAACCINAQDKAGVGAADRVLIMGGGPLGLLHAVVARHRGVRQVWLAETLAHRREAAGRFGVDRTVDPADDDLKAMVRDCGGVDAVLLAAPPVTVDETLLDLLAPGGRISVFSGMPPDNAGVWLDMNRIHYHEIGLSGAYGCTADQNRQALDIIASSPYPVGELITHRTSLTQIERGLAHTRERAGLKSIVEVCDE